HAAQARADARRPRPKPGKIAENPELRDFVQSHLDRRWSPEQICQALRTGFPDRPEMHVVHETVYQALYIQGRGELRRELAGALRTGRVRRKPRRLAQQRQARFRDPMVMISDRPAEAEDRAVPGHWEGDLIIGKDSASAIGTLVERSTRYVMLLHLPDGRGTELVRDALVETVQNLPAHLKRSLTWDQGSEMGRHGEFTAATGIPVYFCDPASPWQRGSNENTNGLLRQYFPKGTDLTVHTREHLAAVAAELNGRPRKTLGWETPAERLHKLLAA
ncbi:IS30 family transposase, partial [Streptomyces lavendulae]|uniref:IS30 family transposase n=1 Tax=Streptomyces lavendulae TaxID=1914 RepID=UPI0036A2855A